MTQSQHKRILWVDYVKGVCMVSVILNHLYGPPLYGQLTYPYELVGFFFVAGYTFNIQDCFARFLKVKFRTLLFPLVCLGLINVVLSFVMKGGSLLWRIEGLLLQQPGVWDDLWFIACLFTMEVLFYGVLKITPHILSLFVCCIMLSICGCLMIVFLPFALPWHIENACLLLVFMFMGYAMRTTNIGQLLLSRCRENVGRYSLLLIGVVYIVLVLAIANYPIDIHLHQYGLMPVFLLSALLGLCLIVCMSLQLERYNKTFILHFLAYIGANTLVYYAFQSKIISLFVIASDAFMWQITGNVGVLVCCLLACVILAIPSFLIRRYAPVLLGKF